MRPLPVQGLVVPSEKDLLLVGLDGKTYGRLVGFHFGDRDSGSLRDKRMKTLSVARPELVTVEGPHGRWYALGGHPTRLRLLTRPRISLGRAYEIVAHYRETADLLDYQYNSSTVTEKRSQSRGNPPGFCPARILSRSARSSPNLRMC
jgi:hypothetical protein